MEKQTYNLSGKWRLFWQNIGTGTIEQSKELFEKEDCIDCMVPGDVHAALAEAGIIKEPLNGLNSTECKWLEEKEFWYCKKFDIEKGFLNDETEIVFEGLDLTADIWLNSQYIGCHNNAFIEKVIDVSSFLKEGENTLVVRIDDGINSVKDKSIDLMKYSWNNEQPYRAWMRKPQFVYGWDWTIWLPTCGIWKNVYLNSYSKAVIRNVNIETGFEGGEIKKADKITLFVDTEIELLKKGNYILKCEVYGDERFDSAEKIASESSKIIVNVTETISQKLPLTINNPKLWWPNGAGVPYLYQVEIYLEDEEGTILQRVSKKHGIRKVGIREAVLDEHSKGFTFMINDTPIFAKGANHVPSDCLLGRITDEKTRSLVKAAADANMNMLRVWGGGIYESESFMEACDELGIMVWHDFMFACGYYPDYDSEFYEEIRKEATAAIKRLRNHSSLIGWSGNNEIQEMYLGTISYGKDFPWYGGRLYEELLPGLVKELCPDRIYRQSSPFGGDMPSSYDEGDQHTWHFTHRPDWEHYLDLWRFTDFDFKFLSEFGVIGAMNMESARKCISENALTPDSDEWKHHTNTSNEHKLLSIFVEKYFDVKDDISVQDYILRSQVIQAEIIRHVYDELRSRKFRCSGILLWTLSDSFGIHNWSVIDYYLGKRPVYYYLKRSMAPVNVAIKGYEVQNFDGMEGYQEYYQGDVKPIELLIANDALEEKEVTAEYQIVTFDGEIKKSGYVEEELKANSADVLTTVDISDIKDSFLPEETILYVQVKEKGIVINENRYFFAPYKKLQLKEANVKCAIQIISDDKAELTFESDTFVWMLHLADADGVSYMDNDFDLIPNQKRVVAIEGSNIKEYSPILHSLNPNINITVTR